MFVRACVRARYACTSRPACSGHRDGKRGLVLDAGAEMCASIDRPSRTHPAAHERREEGNAVASGRVGKKGQNKDCTVPRQRHWIGPRLPLPWHHAIPSVHANLHAIQTSRALCASCGFAVPRVNGDRTRAALRSSTGRGGEGPQTGMRAQHR